MKRICVLVAIVALTPITQAEDNLAIEAMQEYLDFAEYPDGSVSTEQLASIESENILFILV